jgi:hypothetical protein
LDLPDHDSTHRAHRLEVDRLVKLVDLLVWVVDPQKYADAVLHDDYLRPLAALAPVTLVALNHVDELDTDAREACASDLRRLLEADGLRSVELVLTSARTGEGVGELRDAIEQRVAAKRAALQRLSADAEAVSADLESCCAADTPSSGVRRDARERLVEVLMSAAGVDSVTHAVARAYRHRAGLATGWPPTRWLRRWRPDPLRRFHLDAPEGAGGGSSSLPPPTPVQRAQVESALRAVADDASANLSGPWPARLRTVALQSGAELPRDLDRAVTSTDLGMARRPLWWRAVGLLQALLLLVAIAGALWLGVLFGFAYLQLPDPPVPEIGRFPLPTLMLLGGLAAGALVALISRLIAGWGATRRALRARRRLRGSVAEVADRRVLAALTIELEAHDRICAALRRTRAQAPRRFARR